MRRNYIKLLSVTFSIFIIPSSFYAQQQESWETYIAKKDKGYMAITVDMELGFARPNYKNLLIVGTHTAKCLKNGYPTEDGLEKLYQFSDSVSTIIGKTTKAKLAGILTYQCAGLDVFYVRDTVNLRDNLSSFLSTNYKDSKNYLLLKRDRRWDYYVKNLWPKDISNDFFANHEYLSQLFYEGDDLAKKRDVSHWIYFRREKRRQKFIDKIQVLNFKIDSAKYKVGKPLPYEVKISRKDSITPAAISHLTRTIKAISNTLYGTYDGWGAQPVKEN